MAGFMKKMEKRLKIKTVHSFREKSTPF